MKYLNTYGLVVIALLIFSCGYNVSNPDDIIVGKYQVTSITISGCDNPNDNDDGSNLVLECYLEKQYRICPYIDIEFTNDRDYIFSRNVMTIDQVIGTVLDDQNPVTGYYFIDGYELRLCFDGKCDLASFTLEGKSLTLQIQRANGCVETIQATRN